MTALVLSAILVVLAAIHLLWALGYWFPLHDEAALARAVIGTRGVTRMPGAVPTALVTVALLFAAAWPWLPPSGLRTAGLAAATAVFLARGAASYLPAWRRRLPEEPFATLARRRYGPICLALGIGYLFLFLGDLA